jgi:hypothetical protein
LDRRVRERLVEQDVGDTFTESQYRSALRYVLKQLTSDTPEDKLRPDVPASPRSVGARSGGFVDGSGSTNVTVLSGYAVDGGAKLHAAVEESLRVRGKRVEDLDRQELLDEYEAAEKVVAYSENGDQPGPPGRRLSPWMKERVRENYAAEAAERECQAAGDKSAGGFRERYERILTDWKGDQ